VEENKGDRQSQNNFLYPRGRYYGEFTPENLAFNANLQEFAQRVTVLCAMETGGKISPIAAYNEIKQLWKQLQSSKAQLIDQPKPQQPDLPPDE
jgi:NAD-dependent SIR2 family protein deacetylase